MGRTDKSLPHTGRQEQTWRAAWMAAAKAFALCGIKEPEADAKLLLKYAGSLSDTEYLLRADEPMPEAAARKFRDAVEQRKQRVPVQHITGKAWFMGYEFLVNSHVLIPRQDTEILADRAFSFLRERGDGKGMRALDLCTGSGCIAISLAAEFPELEVSAGDISGEALEVARENGRRNEVRVSWYRGDLFEGAEGLFDLIVSNPPYIEREEIGKLDEEVRLHDPVLALDGGTDGLLFYRQIAGQAPGHLREGGGLFFETGCSQAGRVEALLREQGFSQIRTVRDLAGLDRVVSGIWSGNHV